MGYLPENLKINRKKPHFTLIYRHRGKSAKIQFTRQKPPTYFLNTLNPPIIR